MTVSEIGGYFQLPLPRSRSPLAFDGYLALNSARNCLVHLIKCKGIKRLHIPFYLCAAVEEAVTYFCPGTTVHRYHINEKLRPCLDSVADVDTLYVVNYFSLLANATRPCGRHVIVDNAQALYCPPRYGEDTIYCPRKFVGVADGGYLSSDAAYDQQIEQDVSWENSTHLLKRVDTSGVAAYEDFLRAERSLARRPLRRMSALTHAILSSLDHGRVKRARLANFRYLHRSLAVDNRFTPTIDEALLDPAFVPFCYPLMLQDATGIRAKLIAQRIYVPKFWPELERDAQRLNPEERELVQGLVCLPIDQRYGGLEMARILDCLADRAA